MHRCGVFLPISHVPWSVCLCSAQKMTIAAVSGENGCTDRKYLNKFSVINNALYQVFVVNAKKELESC